MKPRGHTILKAGRSLSGHTQQQSADCLGLSVRQFRRAEKGESSITFNSLMDILGFYGVVLPEVLEMIENKQ